MQTRFWLPFGRTQAASKNSGHLWGIGLPPRTRMASGDSCCHRGQADKWAASEEDTRAASGAGKKGCLRGLRGRKNGPPPGTDRQAASRDGKSGRSWGLGRLLETWAASGDLGLIHCFIIHSFFSSFIHFFHALWPTSGPSFSYHLGKNYKDY